MNSIYQLNLIAHVILGLLAVIGTYNLWISLNQSTLSKKWLIVVSGSTVVNIFLSWLTGGYYYAQYYGAQVKPVILEGSVPWAHTFFTEYKEHLFLFLPFLSITLYFALWLLADEAQNKPAFKQALVYVTGITTIIGIIITLAGVLISGAVR